METIGQRVDAARERAGLTQRQLAARTGLPQATLSRVINGTRTPKTPELLRIAAAAGTTFAELTSQDLPERVQTAARTTNGGAAADLRKRLLYFMEIDVHLDDCGIQDRR
ncbi:MULTISPECIES: helix-turn-helix domain-containing protein [unclassified Brachybacterium]|uniref:helix-turn-helix domain-containing protein n=1 Tax=unclassified Brachybacterium TaxID=2623841 RepID=UPI000C80A156|nr:MULTISPECIES: helix-turn-helix transcriptional regulator [unclassified Brachybacterium]PMC76906.1 transcriptional regulator [Brachybacterium sp. UMB0905]